MAYEDFQQNALVTRYDDIYLVAGARTPFADYNGVLRDVIIADTDEEARFLGTSLEQAFLAVVALTALVTVDGEAPLAYAIGALLCFGVGRLTFLRGYSHGAGGRAFGMVTTVLPTLGALGWVVVDLVGKALPTVF